MITRLESTLKLIMSKLPLLKVGDLIILKDGQRALELLKNNIAIYDGLNKLALGDFTNTSIMSGNVLQKSPTTLVVDIKAMLLEDGSLYLFRDPANTFKFTIGKRISRMKKSALPHLIQGKFRADYFDTDEIKLRSTISTEYSTKNTVETIVPTNAVELFILTATQTYSNNKLVDGSLASLALVNKGSS